MNNNSNTSVLLVIPPFYTYGEPNLGISTLKSALTKKGISSKVLYSNANYAKIIGINNYQSIMSVPAYPEIFQERIFANSAHAQKMSVESTNLDYNSFYAHYTKKFTNKKKCLTNTELSYAINKVDEFIDDFIRKVKIINPKIVGFSSLYFQVNSSLAMAKKLKNELPEIIVTMGGTNCYGEMGKEMSKIDTIDYIFDGEADISFPDFCNKVLNDEKKEKKKLIKCLPVNDLNQLEIPDYSDYIQQYTPAERKNKLLYFENSRGCWWGIKHHCKFCGISDNVMRYRAKTPEKAASQLYQMNEMYPDHKNYYACDSVFPSSYFDDFFEILSRTNFNASIFYQIKPFFTFDKLKKMKEVGIDTLGPGIESLSTKHLKMMNKGSTASTNIALLRNCKELNIEAKWNYIIALPEDCYDDYKNLPLLFDYLQHLDPPSVSPIVIQRFSPYFDDYEQYGISNIQPISGYFKSFPDSIDLMKLGYNYDGNINSEIRKKPELLTPFFIALYKWYRRFNEGNSKLELTQLNGKNIIKDTRDCATDPITEIRQRELNILQFCRKAKNKEDVKGDKENLLKRGFLIEVDNKLLSLVCHT
jgi:ribosomal peptide maturation radical SAM protein 1